MFPLSANRRRLDYLGNGLADLSDRNLAAGQHRGSTSAICAAPNAWRPTELDRRHNYLDPTERIPFAVIVRAYELAEHPARRGHVVVTV
jgi:hypothetical protein